LISQGDIIAVTEMAAVDLQAAKKDKALDLLATQNVAFDPNSAEAKRVLRKIDMRIMPMIFTVYLLQLMVCAYEAP
jgi:hypothetical protein